MGSKVLPQQGAVAFGPARVRRQQQLVGDEGERYEPTPLLQVASQPGRDPTPFGTVDVVEGDDPTLHHHLLGQPQIRAGRRPVVTAVDRDEAHSGKSLDEVRTELC